MNAGPVIGRMVEIPVSKHALRGSLKFTGDLEDLGGNVRHNASVLYCAGRGYLERNQVVCIDSVTEHRDETREGDYDGPRRRVLRSLV